MATSSAPSIGWMTAGPLWDGVSKLAVPPRQPAILSFETENFIEELAKTLTADRSMGPIDLTPLLVKYEIASERPPGASAAWGIAPTTTPVRLYQPAHGRFYLVAASLVNELPGFPERCVDLAGGDKIFFVLRRLEENETVERAWTGKAWVKLSNGGASLVQGEQELPLSPINYENSAGRHRRLLVGFIPTASREAAEATDLFEEENIKGLADASARIVEPYEQLQELTPPDPSDADFNELAYKDALSLRQDALRFLLVDAADFLEQRLPNLWSSIQADNPGQLGSADRAVYEYLGNFVGSVPNVDDQSSQRTMISWREALREAWKQKSSINGESAAGGVALLDIDLNVLSETRRVRLVEELNTLLRNALEATSPPAEGWADQRKLEFPKLEPIGNTRYVLRCVYRQARCAGLRAEVVSEPSQSFTVAPFYDPDAPARPIRISLPMDTSIAGLRKSKKNVAFLFSDKLGGQIARATDLSTAFKGKVGKGGGYSLGRICSFSIPIVSLCAMIVLMIFISLLNIVFWWKPFLKICLPIPRRG